MAKPVKVKMVRGKIYEGKDLVAGKTYTLPEDIAAEWLQSGAATIPSAEVQSRDSGGNGGKKDESTKGEK